MKLIIYLLLGSYMSKGQDTKKGVAHNNIRVIPSNIPDTLSIYIMFRAGSIYETKDLAGISHLLEHVLFKSIDKNIRQRLNAVGAIFNAWTWKDCTCYFVTVKAAHYKDAVDAISDICFVFNVSDKEVKVEKNIVFAEMAFSGPDKNKVMNLMFENTPYENITLGNKSSLKNVTLDHLREYYDDRYKGCVICASAPLDLQDKVQGMLVKKFGHTFFPPLDAPFDYLKMKTNSTVLLEDGNKCVLMFRSHPYTGSKGQVISDFIVHCLANGAEGMWPMRLREEKQFVYRISVENVAFGGCGTLEINFVYEADVISVLAEVGHLIAEAKKDGICKSTSEFSALKKAFVDKQYVELREGYTMTELACNNMFYSKEDPLDRQSYLDVADTLTLADVNAEAKYIFQGPIVVQVGHPSHNKNKKTQEQIKALILTKLGL